MSKTPAISTVPESAEARFQVMLDAAPDAMVGVNAAGLIVMANIQTESLFGYEPDELIGKLVEIIIPGRFKDAHPGHRADYFRDPQPRPMASGLELAGLRRDGTEFPAEISLSGIETDEGPIAIAAIRDVTDRKTAEEDARLARVEAARASQAKSDFLSRMSHELRTPLNSILGFGQLLNMDELTDRQHSSVDQILYGGEHLLDLINEILEIQQIESGRISLSPEPVHLGQTLNETLMLIHPLADERQVSLIEPPDNTDIFISADRQRLKQVLLNLLSNAVKFNRDEGEVRITCERPDDATLRVIVSDTGNGISEAHMGELFTPFARLGADDLGIEGTGLGLALSKGLVESMDGTIGATSVLGEGSVFWVDFVVAEAANLDEVPDLVTQAPSSSGAPRTVLYIEDNLANLRLIQAIIEFRPPITLLSAMQGSLGLDLAREHHPDLILLDLHLPDISGEEVFRRLQQDKRTSDIPVIIVSADANESTERRLLAAGAKTFLTKPVNVPLFLETLDAALTFEPVSPTP